MYLRKAFTTLLSLAAVAGFTACGSTTAEPVSDETQPRVIENISYVAGEKDQGHMLDLYFPPGKHTNLPLVVWIHGGAWVGGDKQPSPLMPLLSNGFAVAGINYRLSPDNKFPAQIHDCKAAIRWLRKGADRYGFDKDRIGLFGISAGGHLAALMAATNGNKDVEGNIGTTDASSDVQVVCDWAGPGNLQSLRKHEGEEGELDYNSPKAPVTQFLGGTAAQKPELAKAASPVSYLKPGSTKVPLLIMHGDHDTVVPIAQSEELFAAWKKTGAPVEYEVVKGGKHIFLNVATMTRVLDFFKKNLGDKPMDKAEGAMKGAIKDALKDDASAVDEAKPLEQGKGKEATLSTPPANKQ